MIFDDSTYNPIEGVLYIGASGVIIMDIVVIFIHSLIPKVVQKQDITPYNKGN